MTFRFRGLLLFGLLAFAAPAFAQRAPFPIPDPDPEVERKSFIVADGFEVNLYAADPVLAKPIQMNFDPQGRLWVVSLSFLWSLFFFIFLVLFCSSGLVCMALHCSVR